MPSDRSELQEEHEEQDGRVTKKTLEKSARKPPETTKGGSPEPQYGRDPSAGGRSEREREGLGDKGRREYSGELERGTKLPDKSSPNGSGASNDTPAGGPSSSDAGSNPHDASAPTGGSRLADKMGSGGPKK